MTDLETCAATAGAPDAVPIWHLAIAYDGTRYHGWQIQPEVPTVQGELQKRLRILFRDDALQTAGTSRTDAGVHALDQHVSFVPGQACTPCLADIRHTLNRWLPPDIRVLSVDLRSPQFHARHSAVAKAYTYAVHVGDLCSPFDVRCVWHCRYPLELDALRAAAARLAGTHDFAAFGANSGRDDEQTVKTLHRVEIVERPPYLYLVVVGDSFLYKMVRSLAGYLVGVAGRKPDWKPAELDALLAGGPRPSEVATAPPQGLFLAKVFFQPDEWVGYAPVLPPHHAIFA